MNGLTNEQVVENREKYGSNKLPVPKLKKVSFCKRCSM